MVQKVYFDCTWTGPKIEVDQNGRKTSTDSDIKGMFFDPSITFELDHSRADKHQSALAGSTLTFSMT